MSDIVKVMAAVLAERAKGEPNEPYSDTVRALLTALSEEGWVVVPREPTEAMARAATMLAPTWDDDVSRAKWEAMLSASDLSPIAGDVKREGL